LLNQRSIPSLTLAERAEVARCLSECRMIQISPQSETPPRVREKLAEAAQGRFQPGDRANISKFSLTQMNPRWMK